MMTTTKHLSIPIEILQTKSDDLIKGYRYGKILEIDVETDTIWVDYPDNPFREHLPAKLANPYLTLDNLKEASLRPNIAQLKFIEGNPARPVIKDIYFSLADQAKEKRGDIIEKTVHLKADRIILEGEREIILQSGNVRTVYNGDTGKLTEKAEEIRSTARLNNKVQGGSVLIN
jgi:hypothetical protein